jgi:hypothetical protein
MRDDERRGRHHGRARVASRAEVHGVPASRANGACSASYKFGMAGHRIYRTSVASVYPHYVSKVEKKGRTKEELDEILSWLTGHGVSELGALLEQGTDFETFFAEAPALNPSRKLITGVICGVRVEAIEDPLMQEIRYLDKLVDELARGKTMEKILRTP